MSHTEENIEKTVRGISQTFLNSGIAMSNPYNERHVTVAPTAKLGRFPWLCRRPRR
jgi:hypothetical protein